MCVMKNSCWGFLITFLNLHGGLDCGHACCLVDAKPGGKPAGLCQNFTTLSGSSV